MPRLPWLLALAMAPAMCGRVALAHGSHHHHHHSHHGHHEAGSTNAPAWMKEARDFCIAVMEKQPPAVTAFAAGALVTMTPLVMTTFLPVKRLPPLVLSTLVGFGVGALLGDVFLHTLPSLFADSHAADDEDDGEDDVVAGGVGGDDDGGEHGHGESMPDSLAVLAGLAFFMVVDKTLRAVGGGHSHGHGHRSHGHDEKVKEHSTDGGQSTAIHSDSGGLRHRGTDSSTGAKAPADSASHSHGHEHHHSHEHHGHHKHGQHGHGHGHGAGTTSGYLTLLASISHTFSDGLTLGFAHIASPTVAFSTTLAVLMHELPHKLGDYAILLKSGFSASRAAAMQLMMTAGTFAGIAVAVWLNSLTSTAASGGAEVAHADAWLAHFGEYIIPFTAGGLIYTATVGLLAEMVESSGYAEFLIQLASMGGGVGVMYLLAGAE